MTAVVVFSMLLRIRRRRFMKLPFLGPDGSACRAAVRFRMPGEARAAP